MDWPWTGDDSHQIARSEILGASPFLREKQATAVVSSLCAKPGCGELNHLPTQDTICIFPLCQTSQNSKTDKTDVSSLSSLWEVGVWNTQTNSFLPQKVDKSWDILSANTLRNSGGGLMMSTSSLLPPSSLSSKTMPDSLDLQFGMTKVSPLRLTQKMGQWTYKWSPPFPWVRLGAKVSRAGCIALCQGHSLQQECVLNLPSGFRESGFMFSWMYRLFFNYFLFSHKGNLPRIVTEWKCLEEWRRVQGFVLYHLADVTSQLLFLFVL